VTSVNRRDSLEEAAVKMRENSFSQLPVIDGEEAVGRLTETAVMQAGDPDLEVEKVMGPGLLEVRPSTGSGVLRELLKEEPAVLVVDGDEPLGIVAKADML
ncbi:MAG: CBS domain-containing protein, partial [Candidatus Nanohaloarchaea archaeon]